MLPDNIGALISDGEVLFAGRNKSTKYLAALIGRSAWPSVVSANIALGASRLADKLAGSSHLRGEKNADSFRFRDWGSIEVDVNGSAGDQHIYVVRLRNPSCFFQQVPQGHSRLGFDCGNNRWIHEICSSHGTESQIILQELEISMKNPVELRRRPNLVDQANRRRVILARNISPLLSIVTRITIGTSACEGFEVLLRLAFDPASRTVSKHKIVGSVHDGKASAICRAIGEWNGWRLVVVLENRGIVFRLVNEGQLDAVALKLDGYAHFPTRKAAGYIPATAADAARWPARPDRRNSLARGLGQSEPGTPVAKISVVEQFPSLTGGYENSWT